MKSPTPIIICGMGRSGTRNAADILNAHKKVFIYGEIPSTVIKHFYSLLDVLDNSYAKGTRRRREAWAASKAAYIFNSFGHMSKFSDGPIKNPNRLSFIGHKTPKTERFFDDYERHFKSVGLAPYYIYCARRIEGCWRSYKAMTWNQRTDAAQFVEEYATSFAKLRRMKKIAKTRVLVLKLDDLIAAPDKIKFYQDALFEPLGLAMTPQVIAAINAEINSNATVNITGKQPPRLTDEELALFAKDPRILRINEGVFALSAPGVGQTDPATIEKL